MKNKIEYTISRYKDKESDNYYYVVWKVRESKNSASCYNVYKGTKKECETYIKKKNKKVSGKKCLKMFSSII